MRILFGILLLVVIVAVACFYWIVFDWAQPPKFLTAIGSVIVGLIPAFFIIRIWQRKEEAKERLSMYIALTIFVGGPLLLVLGLLEDKWVAYEETVFFNGLDSKVEVIVDGLAAVSIDPEEYKKLHRRKNFSQTITVYNEGSKEPIHDVKIAKEEKTPTFFNIGRRKCFKITETKYADSAYHIRNAMKDPDPPSISYFHRSLMTTHFFHFLFEPAPKNISVKSRGSTSTFAVRWSLEILPECLECK